MRSLMYITDDNDSRSHEEQVREVCHAGARWVQLRVKGRDFTEWMQIAERVRDITWRYDALLTINDNVIIARDVQADGVHLGRSDMSPVRARQILGEESIVGGSARTFEEVQDLVVQQVDYIGLGPFRKTDSKGDTQAPLALDGVCEMLELLHNRFQRRIPIVLVGGIEVSDIQSLSEIGFFESNQSQVGDRKVFGSLAVGGAFRRAPSLSSGVLMFLEALGEKSYDNRFVSNSR